MTDAKSVGKDLIIGMVLLGLIVQIILFFFPNLLYNSSGLWIGVLVGIALSIHMRVSLETAVEQDEEGAVKYMRSRYLIRYVAAAVVLCAVLYLDLGNIITLLIGLMSFKLSAYAQPVIHKLTDKLTKSK